MFEFEYGRQGSAWDPVEKTTLEGPPLCYTGYLYWQDYSKVD